MDSEIQTNYPDWQKTMREAQAEKLAERAEQEAAQALETRERDEEKGRNLAFVLNLMGIPVATAPLTNEYVLDGYRFWLWESRGYSEYEMRREFYRGGSRYEPKGVECVSFTLEVARVLSEDENAEDGPFDGEYRSICGEVIAQTSRIDGDWSHERAQLANELDRIDKCYVTALARWKDRPVRPVNPVSAPTAQPTLAEQLESLMRTIARDEIRREREGDYAY